MAGWNRRPRECQIAPQQEATPLVYDRRSKSIKACGWSLPSGIGITRMRYTPQHESATLELYITQTRPLIPVISVLSVMALILNWVSISVVAETKLPIRPEVGPRAKEIQNGVDVFYVISVLHHPTVPNAFCVRVGCGIVAGGDLGGISLFWLTTGVCYMERLSHLVRHR